MAVTLPWQFSVDNKYKLDVIKEQVCLETTVTVARSSVPRSKCPVCTITSKWTTIRNIRFH